MFLTASSYSAGVDAACLITAEPSFVRKRAVFLTLNRLAPGARYCRPAILMLKSVCWIRDIFPDLGGS